MMTRLLTGCAAAGGWMIVSSADAQPIPVSSFKDLWGSPKLVETVKSRFDGRLMIDNGGAVEPVGLDGTDWHMGFVDYRDGQTTYVGYAQNFLHTFPGYEGWMWGLYAYDMNLDEDTRPDDLIIVQDVLGDGIGFWDNGGWTPGGDDVVYGADDVLFGPDQVRGDIAQLPGYRESRYLPLMTILANNGPIPGDLNGDGFVGIADLNIVLGAWNNNVNAGAWTSGDPSGDGFVGIEDLNTVLGNWNAGAPPAAQANAVPEPLSVAAFGSVGAYTLMVSRPRRYKSR